MSAKIVNSLENWQERTEMLIGEAQVRRLSEAHVAVFGLGGVGGYAVEALCRAGIGRLTIVDGDIVTASNLNRQLIATIDSIGQPKTAVMKERILSINPAAVVEEHYCFVLPGAVTAQFRFSEYDYVIDALDTVTTKIELVRLAREAGTPIISAMGTGNKLMPQLLRVADIYETDVCPLAKVMRRELRARGIDSLEVVYSPEEPRAVLAAPSDDDSGRTPGSISFVPATAGLLLAAQVIAGL